MCKEVEDPNAPAVLHVVSALAPLTVELAQRVVDVCKEAAVENLDQLDMASPHELFGMIIQRAHQFVTAAESQGSEHVLECLEALKDINMEVALFLYHIRKEILNPPEPT